MIVEYALLSVALISLISLGGITLLGMAEERLHKILIYLVSFSAGALLGDVFIHLLPEMIEEFGFELRASLLVLSGVVFSFVIEKFIHWHHCHNPHFSEHDHPDHCHDHHHAHEKTFTYMNLIGDAFHNFIDGMTIAASYLVSIPAGIATTFAVMLHEIPQEIGDFAVLLHGGFSKKKALLFNLLSASFALIGAAVVLVLSSTVENLTSILIPFTIGSFIYIAGTDLIPELHKETNEVRSFFQLLAFIAGIGIMMALLLLE